MELLKRIFGKKTTSSRDLGNNPPIYGGDAKSIKSAAIINCAAMSTAHHLIDRFISELHGQKDSDWTRGIEYFVNDPHVPEFTVRAIGVNSKAGGKIIYFFNVARPMNATKKLLKTLGKIPDEI